MKSLLEGTVGTTYTVKKVAGGRKVTSRLENMGVMSGVDITLLTDPAQGGMLQVRAGHRELELSAEDCGNIGITRLFRREGDPVLMSSCCSGGNTCELWDRINGDEKKNEE